jgi:hypothetical protein
MPKMGVAIFLRSRLAPNHFRHLMLNSLNTGIGDNALLCSGFFQENFVSWGRMGNYQVSSDGDLPSILSNNNIRLTTVGIYNDTWLASYRNFCNNLRDGGVNVTAKVSARFHWHAKIFILKQGNTPVLGIIGSSNMTRRAFGEVGDFNNEADVFIWEDNKYNNLDSLLNSTIQQLNEFNNEIIVTDYNPAKNFGLSIEQRLQQLYDDVFKTELKDLE